MKKSKLMLKVEARYPGKTLEEILPPMLVEWGPSATADKIGISKATLGYWLLKLQWRVERVILRPDETFKIVKDSSYSPSSPTPIRTITHPVVENTHRPPSPGRSILTGS